MSVCFREAWEVRLVEPVFIEKMPPGGVLSGLTSEADAIEREAGDTDLETARTRL